jgi:hypothetical protein
MVAEITGKRFLFPGGGGAMGSLQGRKVYFKSPVEIPVSRVYDVFAAMMELHDFALIESGGEDARIVSVVPKARAVARVTRAVNAEELEELRYRHEFVSYVHGFEHVADGLRVQQQLRVIAPSAGDGLMILGIQNLPVIAVTGYAYAVWRIREILVAIDRPPVLPVTTLLPVEHADPEELARIVTDLYAPAPYGGQPASSAWLDRIGFPRVTADARTGMLVVRGTQLATDEIQALVAQLDVPRPGEPEQQEQLEALLELLQREGGEDLLQAVETLVTARQQLDTATREVDRLLGRLEPPEDEPEPEDER